MTRRTEEHKKSAVRSGMPDGKGLLSLGKVVCKWEQPGKV